jgi:chitin disaccharide deacetylase
MRWHFLTVTLGCFLLSWTAFGQTSGKSVQERLGYPAGARLLVIHADDLGGSHTINRAIFEALEKGWVTSASVLVPCPWFPEVARWSKQHPAADLGIHLALNSEWTDYRWGPVSPSDQVPTLLDEQGYLPLLETAPAQKAKPPEVDRELRAQVDRARAFNIHLTHLDTHMGALMQSPTLFEVYHRLGQHYGLPILMHTAPGEGTLPGITLPGDEVLINGVLQMQPGVPIDQWLDAYKKMLTPLKPGVYELIVHLAYDDPEMRGATWDHPDWGAAWRQADVETVSSPEFQQFLKDQHFVLVRWQDLARALPAGYAKP